MRFSMFFLLIGLAPGCGLTGRLWQTMEDVPVGWVDAAITKDHELLAAVEYSDGEVWLLRGYAGYSVYRTATREGRFSPPLPPSRVPVKARVKDRETEALLYLYEKGTTFGRFGRYLMLYGPGQLAELECPQPLDWSLDRSVPVVLFTPLTIVVDVVTLPLEILWGVYTIGEADPLLPWNRVREGRLE